MASVVERPKKDGSITYQVKWREGGGRADPGQSENFADPDSAEAFKRLVDAHGQHWPPGWVRGQGFVEEESLPGDVPFMDYTAKFIGDLTGIEDSTRLLYEKQSQRHFPLLTHTTPSGLTVPATICNVTADDIKAWIRTEEIGEQDADGTWVRRKAHPKSIRIRHALLYCIFQAAVDSEPPLRSRNPCKGIRLPRTDINITEEMCFLEHEEYQRLRLELTDPHARDLADWLVSSGTRFGEATALQVRDFKLTAATPTVNIQRAWKQGSTSGTRLLGAPKTRKSRRTLALSPSQVAMIRRRTAGKAPEDFVFVTSYGKPWHNTNFSKRKWKPAVNAAVAKGFPKRPRIHDLRHTHVAWLIAAHVPLPAVQARVGHSSITTTIDRYGHLLRELDDEITAAVEAALGEAVSGTGLRSVGVA